MTARAETPRARTAEQATVAAQVPSTKLVRPGLPPHFVERPRLHEALERATAARVTLVSSHAGTGKTVMLAAWAAARANARIAWLSLDRDDNWSRRFWFGVELALARADRAAFELRPDEPAAAPQRIAERAVACHEPVTLVLDDVHELENRVLWQELQFLLDHAPRQLRVVLSTRADPRLRLQRLRLTDDLTEIRAADLAFTHGECRGLLAGFADDLSDEDVELLTARTEGWAAGLRLAALSLGAARDRRRFLSRFAGDDRAVADYLLNEILDRQPPPRREFLLRTAVPDVLTAELAEKLTGRRDGSRMLAELDAANLVVSADGGDGVQYRYHGLLLEFLRAQLRRTRPRDLALLHRVSARWHWDRREPLAAFRAAVAGRDWTLSEQIAGEAWHVVGAEVGQPALAAVPPAALAGRPCLCLHSALASLAAGDRPEAERLVEAAGRSLVEAGPKAGARTLARQAEAALAKFDGDFDALGALAGELLELPAGGGFDAPAQTLAQRAIALCHLGTAEVARGQLAEADGHLEVALDLARRAALHRVAHDSMSELALFEASRGRLRRAVELATEAAELAEAHDWSDRAPSVGAHLVLGWAHYQWDELEAAEQALDHASAAGDPTCRIASVVLSSLVHGADGSRNAAAAVVRLRGATSEAGDWRPPWVLAPIVETAEARLLAARGDVEGARNALDHLRNGSGACAVVRARLLLADGRPGEALAELEGVDAEISDHLALTVEAEVLTAVAHHALHDEDRAGAALEHALDLASANSYRRPFVDGGPAVRSLLVQRIRRGTAHRSFVAELLAAFEKRAPSVDLARAALLEPLSERERAVLRYLPTMMSNVEIAAELFVTSNTVKTHLKSIYRKLGVARRRDAVERARRLQLL